MNLFEKFFLKRLTRKLVEQGPQHKGNIVEYYEVLVSAARKEFCEDDGLTFASFLIDCHDEALSHVMGGVRKNRLR